MLPIVGGVYDYLNIRYLQGWISFKKIIRKTKSASFYGHSVEAISEKQCIVGHWPSAVTFTFFRQW